MQKKISSTTMYNGHIFQFSKDEVEIKGKVYTRDIIHHHGGVGVLALRQQEVLLVKQYRYAIQMDTYEIPAGKLEQGEDPITCGMRELEEESGYTTDVLHPLCAMFSTPGFCNEKIHLYWTTHITKVEHPLAMDEDEDIAILWIPLDHAMQMIEKGIIQDAKTIIALQFAKLHL